MGCPGFAKGGGLLEAKRGDPTFDDEELAGGPIGDGEKRVGESHRRQPGAEEQRGQEQPGPGGEAPSLLAEEQSPRPAFSE